MRSLSALCRPPESSNCANADGVPDPCSQVVNRFYAEFTGRSVEEIEEATDRDNYMGFREAMEFGIVDGMVASEKYPNNGTPEPFKGKTIKEIARLSNRDAVLGSGMGTNVDLTAR